MPPDTLNHLAGLDTSYFGTSLLTQALRVSSLKITLSLSAPQSPICETGIIALPPALEHQGEKYNKKFVKFSGMIAEGVIEEPKID